MHRAGQRCFEFLALISSPLHIQTGVDQEGRQALSEKSFKQKHNLPAKFEEVALLFLPSD